MARARNIKPSFFQNEELGELLPIERLAFIGMWTIADFKGCIELRPKRLKVQLLPYDECDFESIVNNLDKSGFISIYSVQGQRYIKIINFEKHQNPHKNERESGSEIPDINKRDDLTKKINNLENIENNHDKNGTARADSLLLNPDSLLLNPDSQDAQSNVSENCDSAELENENPCAVVSSYGMAAKALRDAGMHTLNQSNPIFTALVDAGASPQEFVDVYLEQKSKNKKCDFNYILGIVAGRREDAARLNLHKGAMPAAPPKNQTVHDKRTATAKAMFGDLTDGNHKPRIIDVSSDSATGDRPALSSNG